MKKQVIEAILFSSGRSVSIKELMAVTDMSYEEIETTLESMMTEFEAASRGIEIIKIEESYQLCAKKEYYNYIHPLFDKRGKPNLSNAVLETLCIIAYNPRITKNEIEQIRGVNSDGNVYRLLEYNLIEESGKLDIPRKTNVIQNHSRIPKIIRNNIPKRPPRTPQI